MNEYQCCYCPNKLRPQGPITAIVSFLSGGRVFRAQLPLQFLRDGMLARNSLKAIRESATLLDNIEATIETDSEIQGEIASFRLQSYRLNYTGKESATASLILCCSNCFHCCSYSV